MREHWAGLFIVPRRVTNSVKTAVRNFLQIVFFRSFLW
jgi:hypothetical protein